MAELELSHPLDCASEVFVSSASEFFVVFFWSFVHFRFMVSRCMGSPYHAEELDALNVPQSLMLMGATTRFTVAWGDGQ